MSNPYFRFKQFTIRQDRCAMKVGTDSVLLGAWTDCMSASRVLDIGCGTALLSIMIAQRNPLAIIDAVEIDHSAASQATDNVASSPFSSRIHVTNSDIFSFKPSRTYDLIICNPPYFTTSLHSPDSTRTFARHNDSMPLSELSAYISSNLSSQGIFSVILPIDETSILDSEFSSLGLYPIRRTLVFPRIDSISPKRVLTTYAKTEKQQSATSQDNLHIETKERHHYTDQYINLTCDFYLNM